MPSRRPTPSADEVLQRAEEFFTNTGAVHQTLRHLADRLAGEGIDYALLGGLALALHGFVRETLDIHILMTPTELARFRTHLVGRGYVPAFPGANKTFRDPETNVKIEVLTTGKYPGDGKPKPVAFPDPAEASIEREGYRLIKLDKLIELKLASGLSAPHRLRDLADVQDLIAAVGLPRELAERLDPSVRQEYQRLWDAVRNAPA